MSAFVVLMAACGQKIPSAEQVAASINTNKPLTEADYTRMVDYCAEYAKKAQQYFDIINAQPNDSTAEAVKASGSLADLYAQYTYLDLFRQKLEDTDISAVGADNAKKISEYASLEAFPLPKGEGMKLQDPDVQGMIEQMPEESSSVIATGAGEAVD